MIDFSQIDEILKNSKYKRLIVTGHSNIDFDSCGSMGAFVDIVENHYGLHCDVIIDSDSLASNMTYALSDRIDRLIDGSKEINGDYDLLVVLDCSDAFRVPFGAEELSKQIDTLVIDHHMSTSEFGTYRFVDPEIPAVGMAMYSLAKHIGYKPGEKFANAVMVSIYGDSGSFGNNNTTAEVFEVAAEMCKLGANPNSVTRSMFYNSSVKKLKVASLIYDSVRQFEDGQISLMVVDEKQMVNLDASKSDIDGFAASTIRIAGTKVGVYAKISEDSIKFSLRSIPSINVRKVAEIFGGGGHDVAAGCKIESTDFDTVLAELLKELRKVI